MSTSNINNNKSSTPPPAVEHAKNEGTPSSESSHGKPGAHDEFTKSTDSTAPGQKPKQNPLLPGEHAGEPEGKKAHAGHGHHGTGAANGSSGTAGAHGVSAKPQAAVP